MKHTQHLIAKFLQQYYWYCLTVYLSITLTQLSLDGIPKNPGEQDDYIRNKGPIPQFNSEYGCIQDVIQFKTNDKALGKAEFEGMWKIEFNCFL